MRQLLSVIAVALIAGCADQPAAPTQVVANAAVAPAPAASTASYCHKEKPLGSNLPQTVCHSGAGDGAEDASRDATLRDMQRQGVMQTQRALNSSH
jgi:predicted lipoprotein